MDISKIIEKIAATTRIPADKVGHLIAGAFVALFCAALAAALTDLGAKPLPAAIAVAGVVFALTKEACDWIDNRAARKRGDTPLHGVEFWDCVTSAAASVVLAAALQRWL